ncbi:hypothetical protein [Actinospica sp.]|jgi:hypothetical protein|uniref:hypothetical protein n=1 Tax=Actinospica sp. TaxID=1872142 RepID=UPI002C8EA754|nr:hypothetical protein [Actinospica sp.]HWG26162.1 hypothetical protein [Actinospica sp.]
MKITDDKPGVLSLIAAGSEETVPSGIPFGELPLVSLETDEVRAWLEENRQYAIFVMAGAGFESDGVPALSVPVTAVDYDLVISAMPR